MKKYLVLVLALALFVACSSKEKEVSNKQNPLVDFIPENNNYFVGNLDKYDDKVLIQAKESLQSILTWDIAKEIPKNILNILKILPDVIDGNFVVYGTEAPTIRIGVKDTKRIKKALQDQDIEVIKCGDNECVKDSYITTVFLHDHIAIKLNDNTELQEKTNFDAYSNLFGAIEDEGYLHDNIIALIDLKKVTQQQTTCTKLLTDIAKNMPKISMGILSYTNDIIKSKISIPTSKELNTDLKLLSSNIDTHLIAKDTFVNLLLALDIQNTTGLLAKLIDFVSKYDTTCNIINPLALAKVKGSLAFSAFAGIDQLKAINLLVNNISKDNIDGVLRIETSKKASEFFNIISSFIPPLSGQRISDDKPITFAYSSMFKNSPALKIETNNNYLDIKVGKSFEMQTKKVEGKYTIIYSSINYQKYFDTIMSFIPNKLEGKELEEAKNFMPKNIEYKLYINDNGINIDSIVKK